MKGTGNVTLTDFGKEMVRPLVLNMVNRYEMKSEG